MQAETAFFTSIDLARAKAHLTSAGRSILFTMHSGEVKHLVEIDDEQNEGRVSGLAAGGFAVVFDPARVESFCFAANDIDPEPQPAMASSDLLALSLNREEAVASMLLAIEASDMAAAARCAESVRFIEAEMRALAAAGGATMAAERAHEFGGYEGVPHAGNGLSGPAAEPFTILDEPSVQDMISGRDAANVVDHPKRTGRPPYAG